MVVTVAASILRGWRPFSFCAMATVIENSATSINIIFFIFMRFMFQST